MGGNGRGRPAVAASAKSNEPRTSDAVKQELVRSHLPLVRAMARRYCGRGDDLEELVQVGSLALVKASGRFDPNRGVAFASFAAPAVEGEIRRQLRDRRGRGVLSVPDGANGSDGAAEPVGDPGATDVSEDRLLVAGGLRGLEERERRIVFLRFHADMTERQIASTIGISQSHVSRLLEGALAKLRAEFTRTEEAGESRDTTEFRLISPGGEAKIEPVRARGRRMGETAEPRVDPAADGAKALADQPQAGEAAASPRRPGRSKSAGGYSGRILVRMPSELHEQLALAAERDEVSLNRYVTQALTSSVGTDERPAQRRVGALKMALATNLVVVVLAAIAAVVLLVLALERGL
jgi:RNA polymerase sigma-B factor